MEISLVASHPNPWPPKPRHKAPGEGGTEEFEIERNPQNFLERTEGFRWVKREAEVDGVGLVAEKNKAFDFGGDWNTKYHFFQLLRWMDNGYEWEWN